MTNWAELTREIEHLLHLTTYPVAYKRLEKVQELGKIPRVRRYDRIFRFCQLPTLVRRGGLTIGLTPNNLYGRCARIHGLAAITEEDICEEAVRLTNFRHWFATEDEAKKQLAVYPRIPPGEALVLAPLASEKFDPDVILIYGNPAQLMMLMCALQHKDYERFQFFFIGEGACADGLAQCYVSGKPALAIPCYGERRYGGVVDDEIVLALPPKMMGKAVDGLHSLWDGGQRYPIMYIGPECNVLGSPETTELSQAKTI